MCYKLASMALTIKNIHPLDMLILAQFARYANTENGVCFPSQGRIAEDCGLSRARVNQGVKTLLERGFLIKKNSNQYVVFINDGVNVVDTSVNVVDSTLVNVVDTSVNVVDRGVNVVDTNKSINKINDKINKCPNRFSEFWDVYPKSRRVDKGLTSKAYEVAIKKVDEDILLRCLSSQKLSWIADKTEDKFIPHVKRWLERERWELFKDKITPQKELSNDLLIKILERAKITGWLPEWTEKYGLTHKQALERV